MGDPVLEHVGGRIRLYRKNNGLSLKELAEKICKSKASVSKYEQGKVAVDVVTLFDIATALNIAPFQLFDYTCAQKHHTSTAPFSSFDTMHLYHMSGKKIYHSLMKIYPDEEGGQTHATLFYKIKDTLDYGHCSCIYHGSMYSHELLLSFILRNYHNAVENILLNFSIPIRNTTILTGMVCGISANSFMPVAHKILLSKDELSCDDALEAELMIPPESFKEMKRNNTLFIPLE